MSGKKIPILCGALAIVALVVALTFAPGQVDKVLAQGGATIVYNLYATDGYLELPDGLPLYMYGFIGGRDGDDVTFTSSFNGLAAPVNLCVDGLAADPVNGCLGRGGAVAPQGGPWVNQDAIFAGNAQFPAPIIYSAVGDVVEIRLKNLGVAANPLAPNDPHSIHLHGLDVDAANDGVPETSLGAVPANLCLDGTTAANGICDPKKTGGPAPGAGNVIVYMFSPTHAGTYMYHCHQEADIHVQMGMFGALVVYNSDNPATQADERDPAADVGPGQGLGGTLYGHPYDKDYVMLVSEFDPRGHQDEEGTYKPQSWDPKPYNWALYQPQYWQVNGISFPNTIHAAWPSLYTYADWLAAHPGYETLYTGSVSGGSGAWGTPGEKVLLRVINMGFETHPLHMHGYHGKIIGSDQRAWPWANEGPALTVGPDQTWDPTTSAWGTGGTPFNEGMEKNTLVIGSGETYDWLVDFGQQAMASDYPPVSEPPSPFGTATQSRFNNRLGPADPVTGVRPLLNQKCVAALPLNAPVANFYDGVTLDPTGAPYPFCPPIPEFGDPALAGVVDYIGGPTVTDLVVPAGVSDPTYAASQYFPFHNHDDYKATNNGVYPGGMFTFLVPTQ